MSNLNLTGGGLQYRGTRASSPPNATEHPRAPTTADVNFSLMDLWLDVPRNDVYILASLRSTSTSGGNLVATWVPISVGEAGVFKMKGNNTDIVDPSPTGLMNLVGTTPIDVEGTEGTATLTISVATATPSQVGVTTLASNSITIGGADTTHAVTPASLAAKLGVQTANTVPYGTGTNMAIGWTNAGTNGQLIIAATGAAPAFASLTSNDGSITFTTGPNSLDLSAGGGTVYAIQTTDATPTALATIAVDINSAVTVVADIIGATSTFGAAIGGTVIATARRAGGSAFLVGAPIVNLNEDSAGFPDFTAVVTGNNLIIQVTGEAATTYNWKAFVSKPTLP